MGFSGLDLVEYVRPLLFRLLEERLGHDTIEELNALLLVLQQAQDELIVEDAVLKNIACLPLRLSNAL